VDLASNITLTHPTLVARPFHRDGWIYEEKYDGWRLLAQKGNDRVWLVSRNGLDHTRRFAELAALIAALPAATLVLDGEIAVCDEQLVSRFEWLRHRSREVVATPPIYVAFDVLQVGGQDLRHLPLRARREVLEGLLTGQRVLFPARRLAGNGLEAWVEVERRGYEGLVAKDEGSFYIGAPRLSWLKVKQADYRAAARGFRSHAASSSEA
jgi:bifunctional non-homologous end joining protein LigD